MSVLTDSLRIRMDPTTSMAEQFKRWSEQSEDFFKRFLALEEENKNLKLKILELETKETIENDDEEIKSLKLKIVELTEELEKKEERENNCVCFERQDEQTHEKRRMSGSVMPMSSESANSPFQGILVEEEPDDEFIPEDLPIDTQSMDDEIDIKEEDIGYGYVQPNSMSDTDNSIQDCEPESTGVGTKKVGIDNLPSHLTNNSKLVETQTQPQESSQGSCGQKKKEYRLTTRPAVKNHKCEYENCTAAFESLLKLTGHISEFHTEEKGSAKNLCFICKQSFPTKWRLTIHEKTHSGKKSAGTDQLDSLVDKGNSAKRSSTQENDKVNQAGRPEKRRKVESETEVYNDEEMPGVRNPLKKKKILRRILSNLGKQDLLNARLVSRAWNKRSLKVLRKSKFTQLLRDWKMEQYIRFATPNKPHQLILPFHLNFSISSSSVYLARFKRFLTSHVDSLCKIFGPECVSTLTLTTDDTDWTEENIKEIGLIECLAMISPGLKTLDLKSFDFRIHFLKNQVISFPNLKKLICNTSECESGRSGPGLAYISIIENSPNLEDLTLTHPCDLDSWPLNFNQLKSLSLHTMLKPQNILDKILSSSGPPVLRELSTGLRYCDLRSDKDKTAVYNTLKSVSPTLKSLTFRDFAVSTGKMILPKLPHLEHLGLEYNIIDNLYRQHFSPKDFPSLKSIELPIGFIYTTSHVQSKDKRHEIEFPNLNKLILRVNAKAGPDDVDKPLTHLQKIFPTPAKLSLVNVGAGGDDFVTYVLYRIMKSNWYKNIQQIEMIGFNQDCLGGVMNRLELSPRVDLEKWYLTLEESLKNEVKNSLKRIRMEFEETVGFGPPGSIILRRTNQLDCQIK